MSCNARLVLSVTGARDVTGPWGQASIAVQVEVLVPNLGGGVGVLLVVAVRAALGALDGAVRHAVRGDLLLTAAR